MPLYPAFATRRLFSLDTRDRLDGDTRAFRRRELDPVLARALSRRGRDFPVWVSAPAPTSAAGGTVRVAESLSAIPDSAFLDGFPGLLDRLRTSPAGGRDAGALLPALEDLLRDSRPTPEEKLSLLGAPLGLRLLPDLVSSVPWELHAALRAGLDLEARWRDVDRDLDDGIVRLTNALFSPEEIAALGAERSRLVLEREEALRKAEAERQAREAAERARKAEEDRLRAAEEARQEQIRKDREAAFRRALTLGRDRTEPGDFRMTDEFRLVFDRIEGGDRLLFVTGKPGTGKSTLIRALRERLAGRNLAVLSFTGTAALNIGGQTINSFFAMPPELLPDGWTCGTWSFRRRAEALEILVIDEVSMLRPDMLDAMDSSLRAARRDPRPFGGVQLVLVGDLYQLPPVIGKDEAVRAHYADRYGGVRFFFAAKALARRQPEAIELTRVFRQEKGEFLDFLALVRESGIDAEGLDRFNAKVRAEPDFPDSVFYLTVMPHRATAASHNAKLLEALPGPERSWEASVVKDGVAQPAEDRDQKNPADATLRLKPGAQVMMVRNDEGRRWVNGDLGIVEECGDDWIRVTTGSGTWKVERAEWPMVKYEIDPVSHRLQAVPEGTFVQFPLRLAWASTIHKMQGQTVDRIRIDLTGGAFEAGMTYVALSRCRTMEGIRLTRPLVMADLIRDESIVEYLASLRRA